jgi:hypothetical protein
VIERRPDDPDAEDRRPGDEGYLRQVAQRTEERKLMSLPRCATSSPVLRLLAPADPPVGPTAASTAARASGLMAARWGASSPSAPDRRGPSELSPANGEVIGPVVPPGASSSAAQCISGGNADDDTARICPVWMESIGGISPPPVNGDVSSRSGLVSGSPGSAGGELGAAGMSDGKREPGPGSAGGGEAGGGTDRPRPEREAGPLPFVPGAADGGGEPSASEPRDRGAGPAGRPWPLLARADGGRPSGPMFWWGPPAPSDWRHPARGVSPVSAGSGR